MVSSGHRCNTTELVGLHMQYIPSGFRSSVPSAGLCLFADDTVVLVSSVRFRILTWAREILL